MSGILMVLKKVFLNRLDCEMGANCHGNGKQYELNVCFLLKHNIGDCIVHLDWLHQTVLFW